MTAVNRRLALILNTSRSKLLFKIAGFVDFITNVIFQKSRDFHKIELLNFCVQLLIFSIQGQAENYR